MVVVLRKEDLVTVPISSATTAPSAVSTADKTLNLLTQLDSILKNPFIQNIISRFMVKWGLAPKEEPANRNVEALTQPTLKPEAVYELILNTLGSLVTVAGDMSLTQLKAYMENNKLDVIKMIGDSIRNKPIV